MSSHFSLPTHLRVGRAGWLPEKAKWRENLVEGDAGLSLPHPGGMQVFGAGCGCVEKGHMRANIANMLQWRRRAEEGREKEPWQAQKLCLVLLGPGHKCPLCATVWTSCSAVGGPDLVRDQEKRQGLQSLWKQVQSNQEQGGRLSSLSTARKPSSKGKT